MNGTKIKPLFDIRPVALLCPFPPTVHYHFYSVLCKPFTEESFLNVMPIRAFSYTEELGSADTTPIRNLIFPKGDGLLTVCWVKLDC